MFEEKEKLKSDMSVLLEEKRKLENVSNRLFSSVQSKHSELCSVVT